MIRKIGSVKVDNEKDYHGKIIKALEDAGLILVLDYEDFFHSSYDIAEKMGGDDEE